jgi:hypothetical protein
VDRNTRHSPDVAGLWERKEGVSGRHPYITAECHLEAPSYDPTVKYRYQGLPRGVEPAEVTVACRPIEIWIGVKGKFIEVGTSGESSASSSDHPDAKRVVAVQFVERADQAVAHGLVLSVQHVWPVESNDQGTATDLDLDWRFHVKHARNACWQNLRRQVLLCTHPDGHLDHR